MLQQSLEWRRLNGVDSILETFKPIEVLEKYFYFGEMGIDKFDCPVFVSALGRTDLKGLLQCVAKKDFLQFFIMLLEKFMKRIREVNEITGKRLLKMTFLIDMEGFTMREMMYKPAIEFILEVIKLLLTNYPDTLRRVFFINTPKVFSLLFALIKQLLSRVDMPKIKIYSNNISEWTSALLEEIESEQLFSCYGGSQTDPDGNPECPSKFLRGGEVPRFYYLSNNLPIPKDYMETTNIIAGAGGRKKLKYKVNQPQSIIKWEFMTEGGDIGFRLYFKDSDGSTVDLIPLSRVESHLVMEVGEITCNQVGKYVVEFDNTFSYLRPKKLRYHIVITDM